MSAEFVESCGITGLGIRAGDAVRLFLVDTEHATDEAGPTQHFGFTTGGIRATYTSSGWVKVQIEDSEDDSYLQVFARMGHVSLPADLEFNSSNVGDNSIWLVSEAAWQFLPEIPLHSPIKRATTVAQLAEQRYHTIRSAVLQYVGNDRAGRTEQRTAAYSAWRDLDTDVPGSQSTSYFMDEFSQNEERAEALWQADREIFTAYHALRETGNHQAVSKLAGFTRRKAMHAGFQSA